MARVAQILARRSKNNPILLGEPGVGKTAIAEGLARAIAQRASVGGAPLPAFLLGKRVMSLDVGLLMAGAKARRWGRRGHVCVWISDETRRGGESRIVVVLLEHRQPAGQPRQTASQGKPTHTYFFVLPNH